MIKITDLVSGIRPKCHEHFCKDLSTKIERYITAEWWVLAVAHQAVPMPCMPKKNGTLHLRSMRAE
jgi:hypothetical protein